LLKEQRDEIETTVRGRIKRTIRVNEVAVIREYQKREGREIES
jgi:hypothetical protein